jgi:hypothetical protein
MRAGPDFAFTSSSNALQGISAVQPQSLNPTLPRGLDGRRDPRPHCFGTTTGALTSVDTSATEVRTMSVVSTRPQQNIDKLSDRSAGANAIQNGALFSCIANPAGS